MSNVSHLEQSECADRAAIQNILGLYCRSIDRLDTELLKSLYHPDAMDDHAGFSAPAHEFAERIISMQRELCDYTLHTVTHSVIELQGNSANAESYYLAFIQISSDLDSVQRFFGDSYVAARRAAGNLNGRHEYICCGRYLDVFQKRAGIWRIQQRTVTNEWGACRPQSMVTEGVPAAFSRPGLRDRQDPVYLLFTS